MCKLFFCGEKVNVIYFFNKLCEINFYQIGIAPKLISLFSFDLQSVGLVFQHLTSILHTERAQEWGVSTLNKIKFLLHPFSCPADISV